MPPRPPVRRYNARAFRRRRGRSDGVKKFLDRVPVYLFTAIIIAIRGPREAVEPSPVGVRGLG